jgi:hypothetical protein
VLPGVVLASSVRSSRWAAWVVAAQLAWSATETVGRVRRAREENAVVAEVAAALGPGDGLVAPWTWGARVSVAASGDPYGIRWHPPGRFLRDQQARWCADPPERVLILPERRWVSGTPAPCPPPP